ncbi:MAG: hypothetical protein GXP45_04755 [bacterium]|nr:hypothetical protein [bacterium]
MSEDFAKDFEGHSYQVDINGDGKKDIVLRDKHSVYIKYAQQEDFYPHGIIGQADTKYYLFPISSLENLWNDVEKNNGYQKIDNFWLKLMDENWEVKNFKMQ